MSGFLGAFSGVLGEIAPTISQAITGQPSGTAGNAAGAGALTGLGNLLFGNGQPVTSTGNGLFSSGWAQIFACGVLVVIGFVIFSAALKVPSVVSTVVDVAKTAVVAA